MALHPKTLALPGAEVRRAKGLALDTSLVVPGFDLAALVLLTAAWRRPGRR